MKNKYKIKHKFLVRVLFKHKYKRTETTTKVKIEEACRFRYIWTVPVSLIMLFIHMTVGVINWAKELPQIWTWSDKGELTDTTIYIFEKEDKNEK